MAIEHINVGASPNDKTGDTLRAAFQKVNANFDEIIGSGAEQGAALIPAPVAGLSVADAVLNINSIGELSSLPVPSLRPGRTVVVNVLGYYQPGDGGGGLFYWQGDSNEADDGGMVIVPVSLPTVGRWKRSLNPVNIESHDSTSSWLNFLKANPVMGAINNQRVLSSLVTIDMNGNNPGSQHIAIQGNGPHKQTFVIQNADGGFHFQGTGASRHHTVQIQNVGFEPGVVGAGSGLKVTGITGGTSAQTCVRLVDVLYGPLTENDTNTFADGISITGLYRPEIARMRMIQSNVTTTEKWATAIDISGCYAPHFRDLWINVVPSGCDVGISSRGGVEEGGNFDNVTVNGADVGVWYERTGREPGFYWYAGHINARQVGMRLDGVKYGVIDGVLMYSDDSNVGYRDFELIDVDGLIFRNIQFRQPGTGKRHFWLEPSSTKAGAVVRNIEIDLSNASLFANTNQRPIYCNGATNIVIRLPRNVSSQDNVSYPQTLVEFGPNQDPAEVTIVYPDGIMMRGDGFEVGPRFRIERDSASPEAGDRIGSVDFRGRNSAGTMVVYGAVDGQIIDPSSTTTTGRILLRTVVDGTLTTVASLNRPATNASSGLTLLVREAPGVYAQHVVILGEADSGGTGYRMLRVPNAAA